MKLVNLKLLFSLLVVSCILELSGTAYIMSWRQWFWDSIQQYNVHSFMVLLLYFIIVAIALCICSGFRSYLVNIIALEKRRRLTRTAFPILHRLKTSEGYQQRIQEDCRDYPLISLSLITQFSMALCSAFIAIYFICKNTNAIYLMYPLLYVTIGTAIAAKIAKPLVKLNYINQCLEAAFRQTLTRIGYSKTHRNNSMLYRKLKHLSYFQTFFGQLSVIIPYLILAPDYFTHIITFGILMQCGSCISSLNESLSGGINYFDQINKWLSCKKRLKELFLI
jgi:vitamin B12/bleomycin/antimicrobial peptide transport system ATP-binding/permease protein